MKPLALALVLCALVASNSASVVQTCKAKATQQKFTAEALLASLTRSHVDFPAMRQNAVAVVSISNWPASPASRCTPIACISGRGDITSS